MSEGTNLPTISKEEVLSKGQDFDWLFQQGLDWVSMFSGDTWSNYNPADPGVTILQTLCYALTELGYKADFPVKDILTGPTGQITYEKRFYKPEEIFSVNPTTLSDFKRLLLAEVVQVKQVYFNLENAGEGPTHIFQPYLEIKPEYIPTLKASTSLKDLSKGETFRNQLISRVSLLLREHANLAQAFAEPIILEPSLFLLGGSIALKEEADPNEFMASLIFGLNNYLSPYPVFKKYGDLIAAGEQPDSLLEGPFVNRGILTNRSFPEKKGEPDVKELMRLVSQMDEVEWVQDFELGQFREKAETDTMKALDAGFFSYQSFVEMGTSLVLIQGGRPVATLSEARVNYYLKKIIPQPLPSEDMDQFLPVGKHRDISTYYSIQHHFPELYGLVNHSCKTHPDPRKEAKVRQLKGYLVLFEQVLANFMSQVAHLGELFSFESGRTTYQLAGKTYYFQDLYDVPGIQQLLKDVRGYSNHYDERTPLEDWKAYQRDYLNPYRQALMASIEGAEQNLSRKSQLLKHLLARFGRQYEGLYLHQNNPGYGDERTAEVVHISDILLSFSNVSANRIRSYFQEGEEPYTLFSGLELQGELELQLNAYYQGIAEKIEEAFRLLPDSLGFVYYPNENASSGRLLFGSCDFGKGGKKEKDRVEVYQNNELLLAFTDAKIAPVHSFTQEEAESYIAPYLGHPKPGAEKVASGLRLMRERTKGFVLVDPLRFWPGSYGKSPFQKPLSNELQEQLDLIEGKEEVHVIEQGEKWLLCIGKESLLLLDSEEEARMLNWTIQLLRRKNAATPSLNPLDMQGPLFAFLPDWVALFEEDEHKSFIQKKLRGLTPLYACMYLAYLPLAQMNELISWLELWTFWELMYRKYRTMYGDPEIQNSLMAYLSRPENNRSVAYVLSFLKENNLGAA